MYKCGLMYYVLKTRACALQGPDSIGCASMHYTVINLQDWHDWQRCRNPNLFRKVDYCEIIVKILKMPVRCAVYNCPNVKNKQDI